MKQIPNNNSFDEQINKIKKDIANNQKKTYKNTTSTQHKNSAIDLFISIVLFGALGYAVDLQLNTKPLCLIVFVVIGFVGGFYNLLKDVKKNCK